MMYREFNEDGLLIRESEDPKTLVHDAWEIGGCVVNEDNALVGGAEWVWYRFFGGDVEEYEDDYCPSATRGDYSPSCPWNAPGMSISDFI